MKIRRANNLLCSWAAANLQLARPCLKERVQVSSHIVQLLADLNDWTDVETLEAGKYDMRGEELDQVISTLLRLKIILDDEAGEEPPADVWSAWGPFAQYYHTLSKNARYIIEGSEREELDQHLTSGHPMPAQFKSYPQSPVVLLPRSFPRLDVTVGESLIARRTHRTFDERSVSLDQLSAILHYTFAPQRFVDAGLFGTLQLKTSPSAGSRHEAECYLIPLRVVGLPRGVYHYDGLRHALEQIRKEISIERLEEIIYSQQPCITSAFICFTTAIPARLAWKYRHPRAYRLWMMDAGHYAQTFALVATALGLGSFQTIAFRDSKLEELLSLDPDQEFGVYCLAAGYPPAALPGSPSRYGTPRTLTSLYAHAGRETASTRPENKGAHEHA